MDRNDKKKWYQLDGKSLSNLIVVCIGVAFYLILTHLPEARSAVGRFMNVLAPFISGFVIAYVLNSPTDFFDEKVYQGIKKPGLRRGLSILTVYVIAFLVIVILLQLVIPQVVESLSGLIKNVPGYLENLDDMIRQLIERFELEEVENINSLVESYEKLADKIVGFLSTSIPQILDMGRSIGSSVVNGVVNAITALIASIYMLGSKGRLLAQVKKFLFALLPKGWADWLLRVSRRANGIFIGFINGKLVDSAIMGVLCFILTTILRIPYAILVSVVVGITNIIPFFGPIIGAVPCILILLLVNPWAALRFGVLIIALQQFDGNILGPKILGDSTGLSAFWVLVAIVVGSGLFGFAGMILGVPTFAVIYSLVRDWTEDRLARKGINASGRPVTLPEEIRTEQ